MKYILFICFLLPVAVFAQDNSNNENVVDTSLRATLMSRQFSFTEGASVDKHGNVFFTDQPNDKIWEYDINGKLSLFMDKTGRSNGTYFDKKGNLVACADEKDELWLITPDKKVTKLLTNYQGHRLNGPNDVWVDNKGGMYFTDPYYQRPYWDRTTSDMAGQYVFYLPKGKTESILVADDLQQPNGIVGSADGKFLYVADIKANKTYRYTIGKGGLLSDKQLVIKQGSDGMTLDEYGNIYLTGNGVTVYNPAGKKIAHIAIPEKWTANLCFAGKHKDELFITASEGIYIIKMKVHGIE